MFRVATREVRKVKIQVDAFRDIYAFNIINRFALQLLRAHINDEAPSRNIVACTHGFLKKEFFFETKIKFTVIENWIVRKRFSLHIYSFDLYDGVESSSVKIRLCKLDRH